MRTLLHPLTRDWPWLAGPVLVAAASLTLVGCAGATAPRAAVATLPPTATGLAVSFDPLEIAQGLESGDRCIGRQAENQIEATYVQLAWRLDCPRTPGDRTVYFQLAQACETYLVQNGATIGSGSGTNQDDLLFDGTNFALDGVQGHLRITSNDVGTERLLILVTFDEVAI